MRPTFCRVGCGLLGGSFVEEIYMYLRLGGDGEEVKL